MFGLRTPGFLSAAQIKPLAGDIKYAGLPLELSGAPVDITFTPGLRLVPFLTTTTGAGGSLNHTGTGLTSPNSYHKALISTPTVTLHNNAKLNYTIITLRCKQPVYSNYVDNTGGSDIFTINNNSSYRHFIDNTSNIPFLPVGGSNSLDNITSPEGTQYPPFDSSPNGAINTSVNHFTPVQLTPRSDAIPGYNEIDESSTYSGSPVWHIPDGDHRINAFGYAIDDSLYQDIGGGTLSATGSVSDTRSLHDVMSVYNGGGGNPLRGVFTDDLNTGGSFYHSMVKHGLYASYRKKNVIARPIPISYDGYDLTTKYNYDPVPLSAINAGNAYSAPSCTVTLWSMKLPRCVQPRQHGNPRYDPPAPARPSADVGGQCVPTGTDPCAAVKDVLYAPGDLLGTGNIYYSHISGEEIVFNSSSYNPYIYRPAIFTTTIYLGFTPDSGWSQSLPVVFVPESVFIPGGSPTKYTYAICIPTVSASLPTATKPMSPISITNMLSSYRFSKIALGKEHVLGLTLSGQIVGFGSNEFYQINIPTQLTEYNNEILDIVAGSNWSAILSSNGSVYIWGGGNIQSVSTSTISSSSSGDEVAVSGTSIIFTGYASGGNESLTRLHTYDPSLTGVTIKKLFPTSSGSLIGITLSGSLVEFLSNDITDTNTLSSVQYLSPGGQSITGSPSSRRSLIYDIEDLSYNIRVVLYGKTDNTVVQYDKEPTIYDTSAFILSSCTGVVATEEYNIFLTKNGVVSGFYGISMNTEEYPISGDYIGVLAVSGLSATSIKRYSIASNSYAVLFNDGRVGVVYGAPPTALSYIPNITNAISITTSYCYDKPKVLAIILSGGVVKFFGSSYLSYEAPTYIMDGYKYTPLETLAYDPRTRSVIDGYYDDNDYHVWNDKLNAYYWEYLQRWGGIIHRLDLPSTTNFNCDDVKKTQLPELSHGDFYSQGGRSMGVYPQGPGNWDGPIYNGTPRFLNDTAGNDFWSFLGSSNSFFGGLHAGHYSLNPLASSSPPWRDYLEFYYGGYSTGTSPNPIPGTNYSQVIDPYSLTSYTKTERIRCATGDLDAGGMIIPGIIGNSTRSGRTIAIRLITPGLIPTSEMQDATFVPCITGTTRMVSSDTIWKDCRSVYEINPSIPSPLAPADCCSCDVGTPAANNQCRVDLNLQLAYKYTASDFYGTIQPMSYINPSPPFDSDSCISKSIYSDPLGTLAPLVCCVDIRRAGNCRKKLPCPNPDPAEPEIISYSSYS